MDGYNDIKNDFLSENYTLKDVLIYGITVPLWLIAMCLVNDMVQKWLI